MISDQHAGLVAARRRCFGERTGALYPTWYDYRLGEFDVFVTRSTDGGATWTAPRLVNADRGTDHYFSAIDIGEMKMCSPRLARSRAGELSVPRPSRLRLMA